MTSLIDILRAQVLEWTTHRGVERIVIGQAAMKSAVLPKGVTLSRKKLAGGRVAVKGPRQYGNVSTLAAHWPDDGLMELQGSLKVACVVNGRVDLQIGEYIVHCGEGFIIFCPPGVPHPDGTRPHLEGLRRENGDDSVDLLWFQKWGRGIQCWLCHSQGHRHHGQQLGEHYFVLNDTATSLLDMIQEEATRRKPQHVKVCGDLLAAFSTLMLREIESGDYLRSGLIANETPLTTRDWNPIAQARQYCRAHLQEPLTIDKVARIACMSRAQFTKRFRQETGESFIDFLTQCRIEQAKTLLQDSDWSVARISEYVGLSASSHFSELFSRHVGITPSEFRRRTRSQSGAIGNV